MNGAIHGAQTKPRGGGESFAATEVIWGGGEKVVFGGVCRAEAAGCSGTVLPHDVLVMLLIPARCSASSQLLALPLLPSSSSSSTPPRAMGFALEIRCPLENPHPSKIASRVCQTGVDLPQLCPVPGTGSAVGSERPTLQRFLGFCKTLRATQRAAPAVLYQRAFWGKKVSNWRCFGAVRRQGLLVWQCWHCEGDGTGAVV